MKKFGLGIVALGATFAVSGPVHAILTGFNAGEVALVQSLLTPVAGYSCGRDERGGVTCSVSAV